MKKKILRVIFSIIAGFGITILIYLAFGVILYEGFNMDDFNVALIIALVMGTLAFAVLSGKVYDYLKRE